MEKKAKMLICSSDTSKSNESTITRNLSKENTVVSSTAVAE